MTTDLKAKMAARIRALLAKTVDNGCSEDEAIAAADKAKSLMDQYQISLSDTEIEEEGCDKAETSKYTGKYNVQARLGLAIANFCECKVWKSGGKLTFFGIKSDADFAEWLTVALEAFCWAQADAYQARERAAGRRSVWIDRRSFVQGCVHRIVERLNAMAKDRKIRTTATGTDLVIVKDQIVAKAFNELGIRLGRGSASRTRGHSALSYAAGRSAGDRAAFGRPMGSSARRGQIAAS